jgi:hypothetical protein
MLRRRGALPAVLALMLAACGSGSESDDSDSAGGQRVTFGSSPASTATTPAATTPTPPRLVPARSPLFTIRVPAGWTRRDTTLAGGLARSEWTSPEDGETSVLVDAIDGVSSRPSERAGRVRANTSRRAGYEEVAFRATTLAGEEAWEWRYTVPGRGEVVDYFVNGCDDGYAIQAKAPPAAFADLEPSFRQVAESLRSTSC